MKDYDDQIQEAYDQINESEYVIGVGISTMSGEMAKIMAMLQQIDPKLDKSAAQAWAKLEKELKNIMKKVSTKFKAGKAI